MSSASPLVSIVMSAYQAERHLAAALDSALAQTHRPLEIIVVNDGSTDTTPGILHDYRQRHGITVIDQPNAGQSAALNRGLAAARGDYIKFFDSDDLLSPDAVGIQVAALANYPPGHLAYGEWARFHSPPAEAVFTPRPGWRDAAPLDWIIETWTAIDTMYQCGLWLIPAELLRRVGGWDQRLSLINDFELFTRLVLASNGVVHTPGARLYYRSGLPGSLSRQYSRRAIESALLSGRLATGHLRRVNDSPQTRRLAADMLQNLLQAYYPAELDLMKSLQINVDQLGGSTLQPAGGRVFRLVSRFFGWRSALRIRQFWKHLRRTA